MPSSTKSRAAIVPARPSPPPSCGEAGPGFRSGRRFRAYGRLTAIAFGDSRQLKVGDFVLAIGYPANIGQSVTSGIASGLHRSNIGIEELENFIQTDAAIYPGNSGMFGLAKARSSPFCRIDLIEP
jgi:hypothetical protein